MVVENTTVELTGIVSAIGGVALWLQAIGIVAAILIISQVVSFYLNTRRYKELIKIKKDMIRIEGKIDKILRR